MAARRSTLNGKTPPDRQVSSRWLSLACLAISLVFLAAACGSDDAEETVTDAGQGTENETGEDTTTDDGQDNSGSDQTGPATATTTDQSSDGSSDDADSDDPTEDDGATDTTAGAQDSETTASDDGDTTDKSDLLADEPDKTTTTAPPTTVSGDSGDPIVDQVIGMTEAEAIALVKSVGRQVRVADRDGEQFMLTQDYEPERLNLSVNNNLVTAVRLG